MPRRLTRHRPKPTHFRHLRKLLLASVLPEVQDEVPERDVTITEPAADAGDDLKEEDAVASESTCDATLISDTIAPVECEEVMPKPSPLTREDKAKISIKLSDSATRTELKSQIEKAKKASAEAPTMEEFARRESSVEFQKAVEFSEKLNADDDAKAVPLKLFASMLGDQGMEPIFFDSTKPGMSALRDDMQDASKFLDANDAADNGFELRLEDLSDLGGSSVAEDIEDSKEEDASERQILELQAAINEKIAHPILETVRRKLALAHGIDDWQRVRVISVYSGSNCFKYNIDQLSPVELTNLQNDVRKGGVVNKLKAQFSNFKSARVHPLFYRPCFDINNFDQQGNKTFESPSTFSIGPTAALKEPYQQPSGWTRYGLKVLGKYGDDSWLHPFDESKIWWKAYHGTGRASVFGYDTADAVHNIFSGGFKPSTGTGGSGAAYGQGVYCSPNIDVVAGGYAATKTLTIGGVSKSFKFLLMCGVKPSMHGVKKVAGCEYWVVQNKDDIRPYGILVREK